MTHADLVQKIASAVVKMVLDEIRPGCEPWNARTETEQRRTLERIKANASQHVTRWVAEMLSAGAPAVNAHFASISAKDSIKLTLAVASDHDVLHKTIDALGKQVVVVLADPEVYGAMLEDFKEQADQPDMFGEDEEDNPFSIDDDHGEQQGAALAQAIGDHERNHDGGVMVVSTDVHLSPHDDRSEEKEVVTEPEGDQHER